MSFAAKGIEDLVMPHDIDVSALTGAAVVSVPLPLTEGRSGFGPSLALQYNSSAGNSVYGLGWSLAGVPSIGLTGKRHPTYTDTDSFVFNGNEELVPVIRPSDSGYEPRIESADGYRICFYRSRFERNHIRFEEWTEIGTGRIHWRTRTPDNTVSIFGLDPTGVTRIADPEDSNGARTYLWLLEAQYDANGNAILFEYEPENTDDLDYGQAFECHRIARQGVLPQRYLKRIRYGNTAPLSPDSPATSQNRWLFELVLDYGDHTATLPSPVPDQPWAARPDPYSNYRPGFEVRTYRICRRFLMFHHFEELGAETTLVGITELTHGEEDAGSTLAEIRYTGYRRDLATGEMSHRSLPPLKFQYTSPSVDSIFQPTPERTTENFPYGLGDARYRWVDLYGEGLPGILTETQQAWYYKPNLGEGQFGAQQKVGDKPSQRVGSYALTDFDRDGNLNLVVMEGRQAGYCEYDRDREEWHSFRPFASAPQVDSLTARAQWLDLNGDGLPDILISKQDRLTWYPSEGKDGFGAPVELAKPQTGAQPQLIAESLPLELFFADMTGDGMLDQVRISNGRVEYWPHLGNGRFGDCVTMAGAPSFDYESEFDPSRLRLVDLDGSGTTDLLYIGRGDIRCWINTSGNRFVEGPQLTDLPYIDRLSTVQVLDFLGDGTPCLVWSSPLASFAEEPIHYLRLTNGVIPRLLTQIDNSQGQQTELSYGSSSSHYLRDKASGRGWISKLPSHVQVVDKKVVKDLIGGSRLVSRYEYRDGYFDGEERQFQGFGLVDQYDAETFDEAAMPEAQYTPPSCVRTWFHNGAFGWDPWRVLDYYAADPEHALLPPPVIEDASQLDAAEIEDGYRALAGQVIRREVYAVSPAGERAENPYQVSQTAYRLRCLQPSQEDQDAAFLFFASESLTHDYEQQADDPRVAHSFALDVDDHGFARQTCTVGYPRRSAIAAAIEPQRRHYVTAAQQDYLHVDELGRYELGIPTQSKEFELAVPALTGLFSFDELAAALPPCLELPRDFHEALDDVPADVQARLTAWTQSFYWNDDATAALALGEVGPRALLHHQETACFDEALREPVFGARVDRAMLESEAHYLLRAAYWWQPSPIQHYLAAEGFYLVAREERPDGGITAYTYDARYYLTLQETIDAVGNRTSADIDYNLVAPHRITDPNDNLAEVLYDALGMAVVSTACGSVLGPEETSTPYGSDPLSDYVVQPEPDLAAVLAEPHRFLQNASQFLYYNLDAGEDSTRPLQSISLVREEHVHDGRGGGSPEGRIQTTLSYRDGFGRTLQNKLRAEPGLAIRREASGAIVLDSSGRPEEEHVEERWLVSGHTLYNNKQQPVRQYEPFFSYIAAFESDAVLQTFGVSTHSQCDPLGRLVRQDFPNGTFTLVETTPWEERRHDPNDTVDDSLYRLYREGLPDDDPEKQALDKALRHAGTPLIVQRDPLGREIRQIETAGGGIERVTTTRLNSQGNALAITDPRGLTAFTYQRDMLGRVLHQQSIDAGDTWGLSDALDHPIHQWDGRGVHQRFSYDALDRPTSVFVDGALGLNQLVERLEYGDAPGLADAALRNARGRLVAHYDQAALMSVDQYSPEGTPLHSERRLLADYKAEPDWDDPETTLEPSPLFATETENDALGRVTRQQLPDGTSRTIGYLHSGGVARVSLTTADGDYTEEPFLKEASYNARGQRTRALLGNDIEIRYQYDDQSFRLGRLTAQEAGAGERRYQDIAYTYDPVGNITRQLDRVQEPNGAGASVLRGLTVSPRCDYTYDAFYQLTETTGRVHQALEQHDYRSGLDYPKIKGTQHLSLNNGAVIERYRRSYDYDLGGNIDVIHHYRLTPDGDTSLNWTQPIWVSETSNRALPAEDLNAIAISNPEERFDANGNCTFLPHLRSMAWNYRNNLAQVVIVDRSEEGNVNDAEYYIYGGDGIRVRKVHERLVRAERPNAPALVEVTEKIYLDGCEITRVRRNGEWMPERTTSHISDGSDRIALLHQWTDGEYATDTAGVTQKKVHYQLSNHLSSSSLELDQDRRIISYEEYFPYGGTAFIAGDNVTEVTLKEYRYSGKERDDQTGFYYYGFRYYAPWIGNWLSPDPIGPKDSLNLYQFVTNNPIDHVDPDGRYTVRYVTYEELPESLQTEEFREEGVYYVPLPEGQGVTRYESFDEATRAAERLQRPIHIYRPGYSAGSISMQRALEQLEPPARIEAFEGSPSTGTELEQQVGVPHTEPEPEPAAPEIGGNVSIEDPFEVLKKPDACGKEPQPTMLYRPSGVAPEQTTFQSQWELFSATLHVPPRFYGHLVPPIGNQPSPYLPPHLEVPLPPDQQSPFGAEHALELLGRQEERTIRRQSWAQQNLMFWTTEITEALSELIGSFSTPLFPGASPTRMGGAAVSRSAQSLGRRAALFETTENLAERGVRQLTRQRRSLRQSVTGRARDLIEERARLGLRRQRGVLRGRVPQPEIQGVTIVGRTPSEMRRTTTRILRADPNHPLRELLDPSDLTRLRRQLNRRHFALADDPYAVQMGHATSDWIGGRQVVLMGAWENQFFNVTLERRSVGGAIASVQAVDIGGLAVEINTARRWAGSGAFERLTPQLVEKARRFTVGLAVP